MDWNKEKDITYLVLIIAVFTATVLSSSIGIVLFGMGALYFFGVSDKGNRKYAFPFSLQNFNLRKTVILGGAALIGFMFLSSGIITFTSKTPFNLFSSVQLMASQPGVPISIDDPVIKVFIWGFSIAMVETLFFLGFLGKVLAVKLNVTNFNLGKIETYMVMAIVGALAVIFHLASGATTEQALLNDFLFFGFSMGIVLKTNELKHAAALHIGINTMQMLIKTGLLLLI